MPEEVGISFSYNRLGHAVMMATPADLADFATGFSLAEGIIRRPADIEELDVVVVDNGIELRMWIDPTRMAGLDDRRRRSAGPTGCGLCGLESLAEAMRPAQSVRSVVSFTPAEIAAAAASLREHQPLNHATRAVHAAGFWAPERGLVASREDVGRHNALDKLGGHLARSGEDPARGILVLTSRVSVELVQKASMFGVPALVAVSAPTALAVRVAEAAGITLVGVARDDGFEIFSHGDRILQPIEHFPVTV